MYELKKEIESSINALNWSISAFKIIELIKPCIRIKTHPAEKIMLGKSRFGGLPDMEKDIEWPHLKGKPLAFLGQINFSELKIEGIVPKILADKILSFFISVNHEDYREEAPLIHRVITQPANSSKTLIRKTKPNKLDEIFLFPCYGVDFYESLSLPRYNHWTIQELNLSIDDESLYDDEVSEIINEKFNLNYEPGHQLFGYSDVIQGDTTSNWIRNYNKHNLKAGIKTSEFQQLLQIDLGKEFLTLSDGCAYYGYFIQENELHVQCCLQNT